MGPYGSALAGLRQSTLPAFESVDPMSRLLGAFGYVAELNEVARRNAAAGLGLTLTQLNIMLLAHEAAARGGISVRDVASSLRVSAQFVSHEVNRLENRFLLFRKPNPSDGRSTLLKLTPESDSQIRVILEHLQLLSDRFFRLMGDNDFTHLLRLVDRLIVGGESVLSEVSTAPVIRGTDSTRATSIRR
jgi:DNA-binding MarR family transcriptional regulator